jgi:spore coat protein CotH
VETVVRRFVLLGVMLVAARAILAAQTQLLGIGPSADAFFDDSVLHEIRLTINSSDWQSLKEHYLDNTYYPSDFRWRNVVVRNVGIRSRGTGSRNPIKPALRVDFDRYSTDQRFLGLQSVVLRNNVQDASNLNERLSMLLFRRLGLTAPREAHTRLYVNNEYAGLYSIVEAIDKTFLKRTFAEDAGYLYEYEYPSDATPYRFEYRGDDPALYVPLPFKPETHETDPRPEFIEQLVWTINQASSASFRTAIAAYLDLGKFLRHVAVEAFVADNDGILGDWGMNNFYFYQFANRTLFTFVAWDKSEAFKSGPSFSVFHNIADSPPALRNRLMERVLSHFDLYQAYLDALLECVRSADQPESGTVGPGWLEREIAREYQQIRDAALTDPMKPFTNDEFERAVTDLVVFARQRGESVTREVQTARSEALLNWRARRPWRPETRSVR